MSILHVCTQISKAKVEQLLEEDAVVVAKAYFPPPLVAKLNVKLILTTIKKLNLKPHPPKTTQPEICIGASWKAVTFSKLCEAAKERWIEKRGCCP